MRAHLLWTLALVAAIASTSCTALVDLDKYSTATCTELRMDLAGMAGPHSTNLVEVRALDAANRLQCIVHLDPFGSDDPLALRIPDALVTPDTHIDFYADLNDNRINDPSVSDGGGDHSWIIDEGSASGEFVCADQDPSVVNSFRHNFDFVSVDPSNRPYTPISETDAFLQIQNVAEPTEAFELRLIAIIPGVGGEPETRRTVGVFRRPKVDPADPVRDGQFAFDVRIPGVVADFPFRVEMWNDTDGDQEYDPPPIDEAWSLDLSPTDIGVATDDLVTSPFPINLAMETTRDIGEIYVTVVPDSASAPLTGPSAAVKGCPGREARPSLP